MHLRSGGAQAEQACAAEATSSKCSGFSRKNLACSASLSGGTPWAPAWRVAWRSITLGGLVDRRAGVGVGLRSRQREEVAALLAALYGVRRSPASAAARR